MCVIVVAANTIFEKVQVKSEVEKCEILTQTCARAEIRNRVILKTNCCQAAYYYSDDNHFVLSYFVSGLIGSLHSTGQSNVDNMGGTGTGMYVLLMSHFN